MIQVSAKVDTIPTTLSDAQGMRAIGEEAKRLILLRTSRGKAADGGDFAPYTKRYMRSGKANTQKPDLHLTGEMLGSIVISETDRTVTLTATARHAEAVNAKRQFMAITGARRIPSIRTKPRKRRVKRRRARKTLKRAMRAQSRRRMRGQRRVGSARSELIQIAVVAAEQIARIMKVGE